MVTDGEKRFVHIIQSFLALCPSLKKKLSSEEFKAFYSTLTDLSKYGVECGITEGIFSPEWKDFREIYFEVNDGDFDSSYDSKWFDRWWRTHG